MRFFFPYTLFKWCDHKYDVVVFSQAVEDGGYPGAGGFAETAVGQGLGSGFPECQGIVTVYEISVREAEIIVVPCHDVVHDVAQGYFLCLPVHDHVGQILICLPVHDHVGQILIFDEEFRASAGHTCRSGYPEDSVIGEEDGAAEERAITDIQAARFGDAFELDSKNGLDVPVLQYVQCVLRGVVALEAQVHAAGDVVTCPYGHICP